MIIIIPGNSGQLKSMLLIPHVVITPRFFRVVVDVVGCGQKGSAVAVRITANLNKSLT